MANFIKSEDTPLQLERKLQKAGHVLGFTKNQAVNGSIVRKRFLELVSALHPDSNKSEVISDDIYTGYDLDQIRTAKDLLIKHMEADDVEA